MSHGPHSDTLTWHKAAKSLPQGACVELARADDVIVMRDSKDPDGPVLTFSAIEIDAFLDGAKRGEFDHLARN